MTRDAAARSILTPAMERIAVAGLSVHAASVEELARLKRGLEDLEAPAHKTLADHLGASEAVLISTCNRVEFVFARENGHAPARADRKELARALGIAADEELSERFFLHTGRAAARHLFRVVSSLDSLVLGEDQILAQVRAAHGAAETDGLCGRILGPLFERALVLGKRVRTRTDLTRHAVSVVSLAVEFLGQELGELAAARVAVIGAGATGAHAARALLAAGARPAFIVNRSPARAAALAEEVGARVLALDDLRAAREPLDAVISATSHPGTILDAACVARLARGTPLGRALVTVDLAVPPDIEHCTGARVVQIDLEALRALAEANRKKRAEAALEAEHLVEEELEKLAHERAGQDALGQFAGVAADARALFELELTRLGTGRLAHLSARDREAVERWARTTFGRLAHVPYRTLKHWARHDALAQGDWEGHE
jgi:glutamyl-tRNA reductase